MIICAKARNCLVNARQEKFYSIFGKIHILPQTVNKIHVFLDFETLNISDSPTFSPKAILDKNPFFSFFLSK